MNNLRGEGGEGPRKQVCTLKIAAWEALGTTERRMEGGRGGGGGEGRASRPPVCAEVFSRAALEAASPKHEGGDQESMNGAMNREVRRQDWKGRNRRIRGFVNLAERTLMGREGNGLSSEGSVNGRAVRTQAFFQYFFFPWGNWDYALAVSPPLALKTTLRFRHWRKSVSLCERRRRRHKASFLSADLLCAARCK